MRICLHFFKSQGDDDLILEIVVFIGTCASDQTAAMFICKSGLLQSLIELLKAKQEDDEIVLQVIRNYFQIIRIISSTQISYTGRLLVPHPLRSQRDQEFPHTRNGGRGVLD